MVIIIDLGRDACGKVCTLAAFATVRAQAQQKREVKPVVIFILLKCLLLVDRDKEETCNRKEKISEKMSEP